MRRFAIPMAALAVLLIASLLAAPGQGNTQPTNIDVGSFYFCDSSFEDGVCSTLVGFTPGGSVAVAWGVSSGSHTITECDESFANCPPPGGFDSGPISDGETFSQTFNQIGTHEYYCSFHPEQMRGTVVVLQGDPTSATPTQASTATAGPGSPTAVPTASSGGTPSAPAGPAQVPTSGGTLDNSFPWLFVALGITLLTFGAVSAGSLALAARGRSGD